MRANPYTSDSPIGPDVSDQADQPRVVDGCVGQAHVVALEHEPSGRVATPIPMDDDRAGRIAESPDFGELRTSFPRRHTDFAAG